MRLHSEPDGELLDEWEPQACSCGAVYGDVTAHRHPGGLVWVWVCGACKAVQTRLKAI